MRYRVDEDARAVLSCLPRAAVKSITSPAAKVAEGFLGKVDHRSIHSAVGLALADEIDGIALWLDRAQVRAFIDGEPVSLWTLLVSLFYDANRSLRIWRMFLNYPCIVGLFEHVADRDFATGPAGTIPSLVPIYLEKDHKLIITVYGMLIGSQAPLEAFRHLVVTIKLPLLVQHVYIAMQHGRLDVVKLLLGYDVWSLSIGWQGHIARSVVTLEALHFKLVRNCVPILQFLFEVFDPALIIADAVEGAIGSDSELSLMYLQPFHQYPTDFLLNRIIEKDAKECARMMWTRLGWNASSMQGKVVHNCIFHSAVNVLRVMLPFRYPFDEMSCGETGEDCCPHYPIHCALKLMIAARGDRMHTSRCRQVVNFLIDEAKVSCDCLDVAGKLPEMVAEDAQLVEVAQKLRLRRQQSGKP